MTYSDDEVADALRTVARDVGRPPTVDQYREHSRSEHPTARTIFNRFEDHETPWLAALEAAGLDPDPTDHLAFEIPEEMHLAAILYAAAHEATWPTGYRYRQIYERDDLKGLMPSKHLIQQRFGTWEDAVDAAKATAPFIDDLIERGPMPAGDLPGQAAKDVLVREFGLVRLLQWRAPPTTIRWGYLPGHSGRELVAQIAAAGGLDRLDHRQAIRRFEKQTGSDFDRDGIVQALREHYGDEWDFDGSG